MLFDGDFGFTDTVVDKHGAARENLIGMMQDVQAEYKYLPPEVLGHIAERLHISPGKVYSVATFYDRFSLEAKGKYIIRVCDGTACHVRKSQPILEALQSHLELGEKKVTSSDMMFTLETVACLGACGLSPVLTVNGEVHPKMTPEKAVALVDEIRKEEKK